MFLYGENRNLSESWKSIPQQLKSFAREFLRHVAEACQITARPGEAGDEPSRSGFVTPKKTTGTVVVAFLTARASSFEATMIASGLVAAISSATLIAWATSVTQRTTRTQFWDST